MRNAAVDYAIERLDDIVAAVRAKMPKSKSKPTGASRVAIPCGESDCGRPSRKRGLCCTHYNRRYQPNRSHGPSATEWARRNPEQHRLSAQNKDHRRRSAKRGGSAETVDRWIVGERDGWRCGICRKKVNPVLVWPHPMSQSLDHIEPLSRGGHHTYANTRIAHLRCNTARGASGGGEQLALIG
jgi:5-methylcytosine-specific restriction endonuclease McrA